jgi:hypothetical protein
MILLLAIMLTATLNKEAEIIQVRKQYEKAVNSQKAAGELLRQLEKMPAGNPVYSGYAGAVNMIMAKYFNNPISKLESFNKGKERLEKAIKEAPDDIELRFLRYSIQSNTPSFLGYNNELKSDKAFLMWRIDDITDKDLQQRILSFLLASGNLSDTETNILRSIK